MSRKHSPGCDPNCDCAVCCGGGFAVEELPTLAILNMTGGGWSSITNCCAVQDFTFNSTQETTTDCTSMRTGTRVESCEHERLVQEQQNPYNTCPIDPCRPIILCGTESYSETKYFRIVLVASRKAKFIRIYLSKVTVTCEGEEPACKYLFKAEFWYDWGYATTRQEYSHSTRTATAESECCRVYPAEDGIDANDCGTYGDYPIPTLNCASIGAVPLTDTFKYVRYALFDTLPSGTTSIVFDDTAVYPVGCEISGASTGCTSEEDVLDEICVSWVTSPAITDWCSDSAPSTVSCTYTREITIDTDCTQRVWDGEFCNSLVTNGPLVSFNCSDLVYTGLSAGTCGQGCHNFGSFNFPEDYTDPTLNADFTSTLCITALKTLAEAPSGCVFNDPCPGGATALKYGGVLLIGGGGVIPSYFLNLTSYSLTVDCGTFTGGSVCFGAPSWTVSMAVP